MKSFKQYISEATALMDLINKHDDPFSFLAAAMDAIANGTLKLKTRGLVNARELIAAWNRKKKKKIKIDEALEYIDEGVLDFFRDTRKRIDVRGWKAKVHRGKHPDVPQANQNATILFAINPKTGEEEFVAFGKLSGAEITKLIKIHGLRK
jgi:hypothetical protein